MQSSSKMMNRKVQLMPTITTIGAVLLMSTFMLAPCGAFTVVPSQQTTTLPRLVVSHVVPSRVPTMRYAEKQSTISSSAATGLLVKEEEEEEDEEVVDSQTQKYELSRECDLLATVPDCENMPVAPATPNSDVDDDASVAKEALAGLVVALATVPTSIAYAGIVGVDPLTGLWSSVIVGGVVALAGSSPGVIAGAAGVVAVPMGALAASGGVALVPLAAMAAGILEAMFGVLRLGGLIEYITAPTMDGFLNGFGVYLVELQKKVLQTHGEWLPDTQLAQTAGAMALTAFLASWALPKLRDAAPEDIPGVGVFRAIPPALGALVFVSIASHALGLPLATLSDIAAPHTFDGGLSSLPHLPEELPTLDASLLSAILPTAASIAVIGVLETLLAARLVDDAIEAENPNGEVTTTSTDNADGACIALGAGNVLSAAFGGFGGCGLLPQTILNTQSGGRTVVSGLSYCAALIASTVVAAPLIGEIPRASIGGLMLVVAYNTVQWRGTSKTLTAAFEEQSAAPLANAFALLVASVVCYEGEFGIGVLLGAAICAAGAAVDNKDDSTLDL